jgi:hypothetical protein
MEFSITIPSGWEEITIDRYIYLFKKQFECGAIDSYVKLYDLDNKKGHGLAFCTPELIDKVIYSISIFSDIPEDQVGLFGQDEIYQICKGLQFLNTNLSKHKSKGKPKKEFKMLTVGEWVDLEGYISDGIYDHYYKVCDKLCKITDKTSIAEVYSVVNDFLVYRDGILKQYGNLFQILDEENYDESEIVEMKQKNSWSWFGFLYNLVDGNFLDMHKASEQNFIGALNYYSYRAQIAKK